MVLRRRKWLVVLVFFEVNLKKEIVIIGLIKSRLILICFVFYFLFWEIRVGKVRGGGVKLFFFIFYYE